jgi:hypothetical protein
VVAPENLGDVVGLVVAVRCDAAADRGVTGVDAPISELAVKLVARFAPRLPRA